MGHKSGTLTATSGHSRALHPGWPAGTLFQVSRFRHHRPSKLVILGVRSACDNERRPGARNGLQRSLTAAKHASRTGTFVQVRVVRVRWPGAGSNRRPSAFSLAVVRPLMGPTLSAAQVSSPLERASHVSQLSEASYITCDSQECVTLRLAQRVLINSGKNSMLRDEDTMTDGAQASSDPTINAIAADAVTDRSKGASIKG
jgi:hypothetical protein